MRLSAHVLDRPGWDAWLFASLALIPFVSPIHGTPVAWLDVVNLVALAAFTAAVIVHRVRLELPLVIPALLAAAGGVLATSNANSLPAAGLALAQDAYLYVWAVALVALLRRRGDLAGVRAAWVVMSVLVALACLGEGWTHGVRSLGSLLSPRGHRAYSTFNNANMSADALLLGVFALLSFWGQIRRARMALAGLVLLGGMLSTKSNGALGALATGLVVWGACRARARGVPARTLAGAGALAAAALIVAAWLVTQAGVGGAWLESIEEHSLLARVQHSGESRGRIWVRLEESAVHTPLGIAPGNSSAQHVEIGERERKNGLDSKEAHSDYLGYTVERGPLGLAGLALALVGLATRLARGRRWLDARMGDPQRGAAVHAACLGVFAAMLVQSTVIEQLHFRHVWWCFAFIWAVTGPRELASAPQMIMRRVRPSGAPA